MRSLVLFFAVGCAGVEEPRDPDCSDRPLALEKSPDHALEGSGWHRVYVQGASFTPDANGRYGMAEDRIDIEEGDHFLLSQGSVVEWEYPIRDTLSGDLFLHVARTDEEGVEARHELLLLHDGETIELASVDENTDGVTGYIPYEHCFYQADAAIEPSAGDSLLMRTTNLTGGQLGVVVKAPDYFTWFEIEVE